MFEFLPNQFENRDELLQVIVKQHHQTLLTYATGLCRRFDFDPAYANDLLQEFYLTVLIKWEQVAVRYSQYGVRSLCRMIQYDILDLKRKQKSAKRLEGFFAMQIPDKVDIHFLCNRFYTEQFQQKLAELLPEEDCNIMQLYIDGYSYEEIASIMGLNPSTVGVRIFRVKKLLRNSLEL